MQKEKENRFQAEFDQSLAHNAARVGHLMRQEMQHCLADLQVTPEQWQALIYLSGYDHEDGLTQNELAELTLKDKTTISRLIEIMLRDGLLTRETGQDRRTYRLHLSERGWQIVEAAWPIVQQHFPEHVFGGLDEAEQAELLRLLQKVRHDLNDY